MALSNQGKLAAVMGATVVALVILLATLYMLPARAPPQRSVTASVAIHGPGNNWTIDCGNVATTNATVFGVMQEAAKVQNFTLEYSYYPSAGMFIKSINGTGPQGWDGWLYQINNVSGPGVDQQDVRDGDRIVFWYGAWGSSPPGA
jgi:hypothetical protein